MITVRCTQKIRNPQGKIVSYIILYENGETRPVEPQDLKKEIYKGNVIVKNLKLTSDGRLIDCNETEHNNPGDIVTIRDKFGRKFLYVLKDLFNKTLGFNYEVFESVIYNTRDDIFNVIVTDNNEETIKIPAFKIALTGDGKLCDYGTDIYTRNTDIIPNSYNMGNGISNLVVAIDSQKVRSLGTIGADLYDYTVYLGWLSEDKYLIRPHKLCVISDILNGTLDLLEKIAYDSISGMDLTKEQISSKYISTLAPMLHVDLIKILGLEDSIEDTKSRIYFNNISETISKAMNKSASLLFNNENYDDSTSSDEYFADKVSNKHRDKASRTFNNAVQLADASNGKGLIHEMKQSVTTAKVKKENSLFSMFKR